MLNNVICDNCGKQIKYVNDIKMILEGQVILCPECYLKRLDYMLWASTEELCPPPVEYEDWYEWVEDDDDY